MLKRIGDRNIFVVYAAILLLGLAYGLAIAVVALFLDDIGYTKTEIGGLAAWFAGGIALFSLPMGGLIRRFTAKRALVASLLGYAAAVTLLPFVAEHYWVLVAVRMFDGACSVGIWVSCETILLQRARPDNKALVMALYAVAMAVGYVVGPIAARSVSLVAPLYTAFFVAGGFGVAAAVVTWLRLDPDDGSHGQPEPETDSGAEAGPRAEPERPGALALVWRIKSSCFATYAYGYYQASIVLFLPLFFEQERGFPVDRIVVVPAFFAAGMFLFSPVAGRLGDRFGHLLVMRCLATVAVPLTLLTVAAPEFWHIALLALVGGASTASISPLSLALQGHVLDPRDYARANSIYNAFYAVGMLLGPPITGWIFSLWGAGPMLYHLAALWASFAAFTLVFWRDDPMATRGRATPPDAGDDLAAAVVEG